MKLTFNDLPEAVGEILERLKRIERMLEEINDSHVFKECSKNDEPMSIRQVADYLRVGTGTVYQYIKRGAIPYFQVGGKKYFKKSEIDEVLKVK